MTANTALEALEAKWKPILDQVDIPARDEEHPRTFTEVVLTQDIPDPAYNGIFIQGEVHHKGGRVYTPPTLMDDVVGVSPMQAPSESVFALRAKYAQANTTVHDSKIDVLNTMYKYYEKED